MTDPIELFKHRNALKSAADKERDDRRYAVFHPIVEAAHRLQAAQQSGEITAPKFLIEATAFSMTIRIPKEDMRLNRYYWVDSDGSLHGIPGAAIHDCNAAIADLVDFLVYQGAKI